MSEDGSELFEDYAGRCRRRFGEDVRVRSVPGDPLCLLVRAPVATGGSADSDRGDLAELIVGVTKDDPTEKFVRDFAERVRTDIVADECEDLTPLVELVVRGRRITRGQVKAARREGVRLMPPAEFERGGQLPPRRRDDIEEYVTWQSAGLENGAPHYRSERYIKQHYVNHNTRRAHVVQDDLLGHVLDWLAEDSQCFILLICGAGMGKTFLMRELARQLPVETPDLHPVLVKLTARNDITDLYELVRGHLDDSGFNVSRLSKPEFQAMLDHGRIVLMLDGIDELAEHTTFNNAYSQVEHLMRTAGGRSKIVVAARAQHFNDEDWLDQLMRRSGMDGLQRGSHIVTIADFGAPQVRELLCRLLDEEDADIWFERLSGLPWLTGLLGNPRMLGMVMRRIEAELRPARRSAVAPAAGTLDFEVGAAADGRPTALLKWLIDLWLTEEAARFDGTAIAPRLKVDQITRALTQLACRVWRRSTGEFDGASPVAHKDVMAVCQEILGYPEPVSGFQEEELPAEVMDEVRELEHALASRTLLRRSESEWSFMDCAIEFYLVAAFIADGLSQYRTFDHPHAGGGVRGGVRAGARARDHGRREAQPVVQAADLLGVRELTDLMVDVLCERNPGVALTWAVDMESAPDRIVAVNAGKIRARLR
jgi:hypothetical protein